MSISSITTEVHRKCRRRQFEYLVLIAFQGFFVGSFLDVLRIVPAIGIVVCTIGMSWTLTQYRQKRCTLPENNSFRVIVDVLEVFALLLFVTIFSIVALSMNIDVFVFQAHVSLMLMSFFAGTVATEHFWVQKIFPTLNPAQQLNYAINLNVSILLPFKKSQLKRLFQWKVKD